MSDSKNNSLILSEGSTALDASSLRTLNPAVVKSAPWCQYCRTNKAIKLVKIARGRRWKCATCIKKQHTSGVF